MFKHYLRFISLGQTNLYQICEPIGFTDAEFALKQNSKRYSRDISYCALDKLSFVDAFGENIDVAQVINERGDTSKRLNYGLEWLLYIYKTYGFEAKVEYVLQKYGLDFSIGMLDFTDKELTDGYTYFNCKLIQNDNVADFKRNFDTKFNAFSDKDVKDNTITPINTFNYLRKAIPLQQKSKWKGNNNVATAQAHVSARFLNSFNTLANNSNAVEEYGISNTLSFLSPIYTKGLAFDNNGVLQPIPVDSGSFQYVEAKNDFSNTTIKFTNINAQVRAVKYDFLGTHVLTASGKARLLMLIGGFDLATEGFDTYELWSKDYNDITDFNSIYTSVPSSIDINVPIIERSKRIYIFFANDCEATFDNSTQSLAYASVETLIHGMNIEITATSTAIDVVMKATRYIDLIKQSAKFINSAIIDAPLYDVGGTHYNTAVFNRRMISQKTDYFYSTPKDVLENIEELNCDYEITDNSVQIRRFNGYYENAEIGVFQMLPDKESYCQFNDRLMVNNFKFNYKKSSQSNSSNIIDGILAIHSNMEWIVPNQQVENKKDISIGYVRDGILTQSVIDTEIKTPTTSTDNDDELFVEDFVDLQPNSFGTFGARLLMQWSSSELKILNRDSNGDSSDVVISWANLGQAIGGTFYITNGVNIGTYTIVDFTTSVLTLTPTTSVSQFSGDGYIKVKYFYTNVPYQTRLLQGFILPTTAFYSNINYTIRRNMKYFSSLFASYMLYAKSKMKTVSNINFESQLFTETSKLKENSDYLYTDFDAPILGTLTYNLTLVASFEDIYNYLKTYKTTKGWIRCYDTKGKILKLFIQYLSYNWISHELKITGEQLYETEILTLTFANGILNVNDVAYNLSGVSNWWKFENDFVQFFDNKSIPISNFYKYNFVNLNGIVYNTCLDLQNALISLV
jgi:hypothetical protein